MTETAKARTSYVKHTKRIVRTTAVRGQAGTRVRRVVTRTTATCPPATVQIASQPLPLPPVYAGSSGDFPVSGGSGGSAPIIIGGSGGFGGG
ncbi:MAG: hypothetical protein K2P79_04245, partial [Sphingomonas sp.]|nr:hypothetical protein [Sphingomonas sp.]